MRSVLALATIPWPHLGHFLQVFPTPIRFWGEPVGIVFTLCLVAVFLWHQSLLLRNLYEKQALINVANIYDNPTAGKIISGIGGFNYTGFTLFLWCTLFLIGPL